LIYSINKAGTIPALSPIQQRQSRHKGDTMSKFEIFENIIAERNKSGTGVRAVLEKSSIPAEVQEIMNSRKAKKKN
jgi:hypothetical protein